MATPAGALIELYEVDASAIGGSVYRFVNEVNELGSDIVWQGQTYLRLPVEATGFDISGNTQLPRPKLTFSNVNQVVGGLARTHGDLIGAIVKRHRTFAKYLDAVNFTAGNTQADPNTEFPLDVFIVEQKVSENKLTVEFELVSAVDLAGVKLPKRQLIASSCNAVFKSSRCGYVGSIATCDKGLSTVNGCKTHFGADAELPYNGFPGCGLRRA